MLGVLLTTAVSVGFIHTAMGIDHTLPFIVLARARKWSLAYTLWITFICGLFHVLSSVVLGGIGIGFGIAASKLQLVEEVRGNWAAWFLIGFGLIYSLWSVIRGMFSSKAHLEELAEEERSSQKLFTVWGLFIIFVLGPCEPLIPLMMIPAFKLGVWATIAVVSAFSLVTIGSMLLLVTLGYLGVSLLPLRSLERYSHLLAGLAISISGVAIKLFGL